MTIGLLHHTGGGNLGDEGNQTAVIQNITKRWPGASIVGLTMNPDDTVARHGIPAHPIRRQTWQIGAAAGARAPTPKEGIKTRLRRFPTLFVLLSSIHAAAVRMPVSFCQEVAFLARSFRVVRSLNLLIVNGGGQLTEWGGAWAFTYTVCKWVCLARLARVRCYVLNIGLGPLTQPLSRFFASRALRCADYVSFRDEESQALAREIGFTGDSHICPDNVYGLEVAALRAADSASPERKRVGVAPMPYCDPRAFFEKDQRVYDNYIRKLAQFTAQLIRSGYVVALLAGDIGVDPMAVEDLQEALKKEGITAACGSLTTSRPRSSGELLSTMASFDYVVVCRFHGVVSAHLLNLPVMALSHHPKVAALMSDIGLSKYCVDIRTFTDESLTQAFRALVDDEPEVRRRMADRLVAYRGRLSAQFDELFPGEAL